MSKGFTQTLNPTVRIAWETWLNSQKDAFETVRDIALAVEESVKSRKGYGKEGE